MFKNLKLGTQISIGFATILILMIITSSSSYIGLGNAVEGFNEYRSLARNANLSSRIESTMLLARLYVKDFLI